MSRRCVWNRRDTCFPRETQTDRSPADSPESKGCYKRWRKYVSLRYLRLLGEIGEAQAKLWFVVTITELFKQRMLWHWFAPTMGGGEQSASGATQDMATLRKQKINTRLNLTHWQWQAPCKKNRYTYITCWGFVVVKQIKPMLFCLVLPPANNTNYSME